MTLTKELLAFPVFFDKVEEDKKDSKIAKRRLAIYYLGENRNGSFINQSVSDMLIESISYSPIKGIYIEEEKDFGSHSKNATEKSKEKIFGVVPKEYNFAWEKRTSPDGVTKDYACVDVLLFTAAVPEANLVTGKAHSMELYPPSIEGEWVEKDGRSVFHFTKAEFLGLQVLGSSTEPCFEESAFFSAIKQIKDKNEDNSDEELIRLLENYSLQSEVEMNEKDKKIVDGEGTDVANPKYSEFRLAIQDKAQAFSVALGAKAADKYRFSVVTLYDNHGIAYDYEERKIMKFNYVVDEITDILSITSDGEEVFAEYLTQAEKEALNALVIAEKAELEKVTADFTKTKEENEILISEKAKFEIEKEELVTKNSTLVTENESLTISYSELEKEKEALVIFKNQIVKEEKMAIIERYESKLSTEVVEKIKSEMDNYSIVELEKELAYNYMKTDPKILEGDDSKFEYGFRRRNHEEFDGEGSDTNSDLAAAIEASKNKKGN